MKINVLFACILLGLAALGRGYVLPALNCIQNVTFDKPYGNYNTSALFLSDYSESRNTPELLYYSNTPQQGPTFWVATAGNDIGLIADLGAVSLGSLDWESAGRSAGQYYQSPYDNTHIKFVTGHVYSALVMKTEFRAGYYFELAQSDPSGKVVLNYAVKFYEIHSVTARAPGFDWSAANSPTCNTVQGY